MVGVLDQTDNERRDFQSEFLKTTDLASGEAQIGALRELVVTLLKQLELLDHQVVQSDPEHHLSTLQDEVRRFEIELINNALCLTHGHQYKAAKLLGVKPTTLNSKIKRYQIMFPFLTIGAQSRLR